MSVRNLSSAARACLFMSVLHCRCDQFEEAVRPLSVTLSLLDPCDAQYPWFEQVAVGLVGLRERHHIEVTCARHQGDERHGVVVAILMCLDLRYCRSDHVKTGRSRLYLDRGAGLL